jgi:phage protein U
MSNAELSDSGSLVPPLADIEKQWQEFGVADDIINIDTEFSPKRQKTGGESMSNITQYSVQRRAMMLGLTCWPGLVGGV